MKLKENYSKQLKMNIWNKTKPNEIENETEFQKISIVDFREHSMKDFARLNVYIADSNVIITQEMEDYSSTQLVSDIGGQLGLWVGISIITLAEVSNKL